MAPSRNPKRGPNARPAMMSRVSAVSMPPKPVPRKRSTIPTAVSVPSIATTIAPWAPSPSATSSAPASTTAAAMARIGTARCASSGSAAEKNGQANAASAAALTIGISS
ncbi:hypothetical protein LEUCIP111803_01256 [Leucobacter soli]|uniref:Uncharacterized protein n=1 Tax=Leucobacter soli TaxID=2812850 RepID=A0A916JW78_9MICO|nr:hypothetical protein LEUCIP111803_01256 [Leucobacter soli]